MAYPGARIPETPLIGSCTTVAATIADLGMDRSPCSAPAFSAVDSRTVTMSGVTVMVGICLVLPLDGRHRPTVGLAFNPLPLTFERPLLPPAEGARTRRLPDVSALRCPPFSTPQALQSAFDDPSRWRGTGAGPGRAGGTSTSTAP